MNIAPSLSVRTGFHRMGSRYGSLVDPDYFMGRNPWDGLRLTSKDISSLADKKVVLRDSKGDEKKEIY